MLQKLLQTLTLTAIAFFLSLSTVFAQESPTGMDATESDTAMMETSTMADKGPLFVANETVLLNEEYAGSVFAAGGTITMSGHVQQDLLVAGGTIHITGQVDQDVYAAGGTVIIEGQVHGNVVAAGGEIQVSPTAQIDGALIAGTERLSLDGLLEGPLYAGGKRIFLNGLIGGDVKVGSDTLELGNNASIAGNLRAEVGQPYTANPDASIAGTTDVQQNLRQSQEKKQEFFKAGSLIWKGFFRVVWRFAFLAVLLLVLPKFMRAGAERLSEQPGGMFITGVVTLIGVPFLLLLVAVTIVGFPVAIILGLLYLVSLLTAWTIPSLWVGQRILPEQNQYLQALLGVAVVVVLGLIPLVGGLVKLMVLTLGLGTTLSLLAKNRA